jgi:hypothetical protein
MTIGVVTPVFTDVVYVLSPENTVAGVTPGTTRSVRNPER